MNIDSSDIQANINWLWTSVKVLNTRNMWEAYQENYSTQLSAWVAFNYDFCKFPISDCKVNKSTNKRCQQHFWWFTVVTKFLSWDPLVDRQDDIEMKLDLIAESDNI